jgi:hypothetical protein
MKMETEFCGTETEIPFPFSYFHSVSIFLWKSRKVSVSVPQNSVSIFIFSFYFHFSTEKSESFRSTFIPTYKKLNELHKMLKTADADSIKQGGTHQVLMVQNTFKIKKKSLPKKRSKSERDGTLEPSLVPCRLLSRQNLLAQYAFTARRMITKRGQTCHWIDLVLFRRKEPRSCVACSGRRMGCNPNRRRRRSPPPPPLLSSPPEDVAGEAVRRR